MDSLATTKTCAVIMEPIQGESRINVASESFFEEKESKSRCDEVILMRLR